MKLSDELAQRATIAGLLTDSAIQRLLEEAMRREAGRQLMQVAERLHADQMTLQPREEHPHGLSNKDFDALFTKDQPIIFAYHGYPWLIHRLTYRRTNHGNLHVRGYKEEGTTSTPFDMVVRNDLDRFHLAADAVERVPRLAPVAAYIKQCVRDKLVEHNEYIVRRGVDLPEAANWNWPY